MEERPVLVVGEGVVDLLIPQDAAVGGGEVDEFHPEGVADEVVGEDRGALEAGVGPSGAAGVGDVEFGDGDGVDFVGGFGDGAFDRLFFVVGEDGGHLGVGSIAFNGGRFVRFIVLRYVSRSFVAAESEQQ